MMNIDATFEIVKARQADLRLLAGPQPMIPLTDPPFESLRRIGRLISRLGDWAGAAKAPLAPAETGASRQ